MSEGHHHTVSGQNVVLDVGGEIGALVVYTPADLAGQEIEISPADGDGPRTHTEVHARKVLDGQVHAGVFPELTAGLYHLWPPGADAGVPVWIEGGMVAECDWR